MGLGAAGRSGVMADSVTARKERKYRDAVRATRAHFFAGVVERYGACGGGMVGLLRMLAGEGDRELSDPDWSPAATSRVTWLSQGVVFGAVMADAAMLAGFGT